MENQSSGKAVAGLVLGIVSCSMTLFGAYGSIIGIICGVIGLIISIGARKENPTGMATAGFVLSIVGTVLCVIFFVACACLIGGLASLGSSY